MAMVSLDSGNYADYSADEELDTNRRRKRSRRRRGNHSLMTTRTRMILSVMISLLLQKYCRLVRIIIRRKRRRIIIPAPPAHAVWQPRGQRWRRWQYWGESTPWPAPVVPHVTLVQRCGWVRRSVKLISYMFFSPLSHFTTRLVFRFPTMVSQTVDRCEW